MNVLVACEFSGTVRDAFRAAGHSAWSCDLMPSEGETLHHIQGDALQAITAGRPTDGAKWDLLIAHPPCTHLAVSGARWATDHWVKRKNKPDRWHDGSEKRRQQKEAIAFFLALCRASVPRICVENPVCIMSSHFRKPDQVIQPWQFGHGETKATCLWLKELPPLMPTHRKDDLFAEQEPAGREQRIHKMPPGPTRWKERSRTFAGIAAAMAAQWGKV